MPNISVRGRLRRKSRRMNVTDLAQPTSNLAGFAAGSLSFAASPLFAAMAAFSGNSPGSIICSAVSALLPINDMALMYLLMSLFHMTPWLTLLSQRPAAQPDPFPTIQGD
jgi:hypothetical protein